MERTWRWFGKKDKITLAMLKQIGVEGIVTALHDVPLGEVWTREKIRDLREYIESRLDFADDRIFAAYVFAIANAYGLLNSVNFQIVDAGLRAMANAVWFGREITRKKYVDVLVDTIIGDEDSPATTLRTFEAANDQIGPEERKLILRGK